MRTWRLESGPTFADLVGKMLEELLRQGDLVVVERTLEELQ
jgi:hypothetical protein